LQITNRNEYSIQEKKKENGENEGKGRVDKYTEKTENNNEKRRKKKSRGEGGS